MRDAAIRKRLLAASVPGELEAQRRAWSVVRNAFAERERVSWPRKHTRPLLLAATAAALVAAAVTPPGQAVLGSIRDAVGRERVTPSRPALLSLPAAGRLLVTSPDGAWIVERDGSRRLFSGYAEADWSPHGLFVAGARGHELVAFEPNAERRVHWALARAGLVRHPRWAPDGYRIAYFAGHALRVVVGDGTNDRLIARATPIAPAWEPLPIHEPVGSRHVLTFVDGLGRVAAVDTDTHARLWRVRAMAGGVRQLAWSNDGRRLLVRGAASLRAYRGDGRLLGVFATKRPALAAAFKPRSHRFAFVVGGTVLLGSVDRLRARVRPLFTGAGDITDLAWSPDGRWLLVGWRSADQWLFIRAAPVRKIVAVSNLSREFTPGGSTPPFPAIEAWCCEP
jgi:hypothetical protein